MMRSINGETFTPKFVGRDEEMGRLKQCLDDAIDAHGNFVIVKGEAGIGKTRLVTELEEYAKNKDFNVLNGTCFENSTPYLPFVNALSGTTTLSAITRKDEQIVIDDVFLVYHDGRMLSHETRRLKPGRDSDILTSMFTAVQDFVKDSFGKGEMGMLDELKYGGIRILTDHGEHVYLAVVVSGEETGELREHMRKCIKEIEENYGGVLESWDGDFDAMSGAKEYIKKLIFGEYETKRGIRIDPKMEKERMFTMIGDLVTNMATEKPLMLFFDDIQWADDSSLALLHYIVRTTTDSKVFIVGAYRPEELIPLTTEERRHGLTDALRKMSRDRLYRTLELERLKEEDVRKMLDLSFSNHTFSDKFITTLYNHIEGNPYFIVEMLRSMIEDNAIYKDGGKWLAKDITDVRIPTTINAVVSRRIDRLSDDHRKLLGYCSVIGHELDYGTLHKSTGIAEEELVDNLEILLGTKMIHETKDESYVFDHPMIREVLYANLSGGLRRLMHKKVARSIEELNKHRINEMVYDLAYHYRRAKDDAKTLEYAARAGEKAKNVYALGDAIKYYKWTLEVLGKLGTTTENKENRLLTLMNLGNVCNTAGEWDDALSYFDTAIAHSKDVGDDVRLAESYRNIGEVKALRNDWDAAVEKYKKGLEISEKTDDKHGIADAYMGLGYVYWRNGKYDEALTHFNKAMQYAKTLDNQTMIAYIYLRIGTIYWGQGKRKEATEYLDKSIETAQRSNALYAMAMAYNNLGEVNRVSGEYDKAIEYYEKQMALSKKIGFIRLTGFALTNLGNSEAKLGHLEKAKLFTDEALKIFKKLDEKYMISGVYTNYGVIYKLERNWDKALEYLKASTDILEELEMPYDLGETYYEFGLMYKAKDDLTTATEYFEKARQSLASIGAKEYLKKVETELSKLRDKKEVLTLYSEFINRESEMAELKGYIEGAIRGKGRLLLVKGEVGVGKTRLMSELRNYARSEGISFISGRCKHTETAEPYLPFIDALSEYFETCKSTERVKTVIGNTPPDVVRMIPAMSGLSKKLKVAPTGVERAGPLANLQTEKERLFEELSQLISRISKEEPIILLIENIQWIDTTSLALLHYIARTTKNANVLICGTYRPEEIGRVEEKLHPVAERFNLMIRDGLLTTMELGRLTKDNVSQMVKSMTNVKDVLGTVVEFVYEKSEGNPYFVEGVLRALIEDEIAQIKGEKLLVQGKLTKITLPMTVSEVIIRSINRLSGESKDVLEYASVVGREFQTDVLQHSTDIDEEKLIETLDKLMDLGLVMEVLGKEGEVYKFYHPLIQEVTYNRLDADKKESMHCKVGQSIEKLNKENIDAVVYALARHFTSVREFEKAVEYSVKAGDKAKGVYAPEEAVRYYKMALESLDKLEVTRKNKERKIGLLDILGVMCHVIGEIDRAIEYHSGCIGLCEEMDNNTKRAESFLKIGEIQMNRANYDEAIEHVENALKIYEATNDIHGIADAYYRKGRVCWQVGKLDEASKVLNKALELGKKLIDKEIMAKSLMDIGIVYHLRGEHEKGISFFKRSLELFEEINDMYEMTRAYNNIGDSHWAKGEYEDAIKWFEKQIKVASEIGYTRLLGYGLANIAENYANIDELDRGLEHNDKAKPIFEKLNEKKMMSAIHRNYGVIYGKKMEWGKAIEHFEKATKIAEEIENSEVLSQGHFEYGKMFKAKGDKEKAREQFEKAIGVYEKLGNKTKVEEIRKVIGGL